MKITSSPRVIRLGGGVGYSFRTGMGVNFNLLSRHSNYTDRVLANHLCVVRMCQYCEGRIVLDRDSSWPKTACDIHCSSCRRKSPFEESAISITDGETIPWFSDYMDPLAAVLMAADVDLFIRDYFSLDANLIRIVARESSISVVSQHFSRLMYSLALQR